MIDRFIELNQLANELSQKISSENVKLHVKLLHF
jgi:hypothetical protein